MTVGRLGLQFLILTAARSGEVRGAPSSAFGLTAPASPFRFFNSSPEIAGLAVINPCNRTVRAKNDKSHSITKVCFDLAD